MLLTFGNILIAAEGTRSVNYCKAISARLSQTAVDCFSHNIHLLCTAFGGAPQQWQQGSKGMSCITSTGNVQAFKVTITDCCSCKRNAVLVAINLHDELMWTLCEDN